MCVQSASARRPGLRGPRVRALCLSALASLAAGCAEAGGEPEAAPGRVGQAIAGGVDEEGHFEVVRVRRTRDGEGSSCTGVVIAPDLVLTARHCVDRFREPVGACASSKAGRDAGGELAVTLREPGGAKHKLPVSPDGVRVPGGEDNCGADIALLRVPDMLRFRDGGWVQAASPRLDRALRPGEPYTAVGFGDADAEGNGSGVLRRRDGLTVSCLGVNCAASEGALPHEWEGEAGVCGGDSGGPALDEEGHVVGIASRSNADDCAGPIYASVFAWRHWLREEALSAARLSAYRRPLWTTRVAAEGEGEDESSLAISGGSCSLRPAGQGRGPSALAALALGLALFGARRRGAR
ncbi:MAG TPA: S1 family peptidase [Polyangiaceae bacterium]|nr:S1 family peptidase [Polyangiaceae bacterium]